MCCTTQMNTHVHTLYGHPMTISLLPPPPPPPHTHTHTHILQVLRRAVGLLVRLRRHETVRLDMIMRGLRTRGMPWLVSPTHAGKGVRTPPALHRARQAWLAAWVWWLLARLALPLLRSGFYVTESEPHRQAVFYYRKPVWSSLAREGLRQLTSSCFTRLRPVAAAAVLQGRLIGVAALRLLPKRAGMRPIARLSASSRARFRVAGMARGEGRRRELRPAVAVGARRAAGAVLPAQHGQQHHEQQRGHGRRGGPHPAGMQVPGVRGAGVGVGTTAAMGATKRRAAAAGMLDLSFRPINSVLQPAFQVWRHMLYTHTCAHMPIAIVHKQQPRPCWCLLTQKQ